MTLIIHLERTQAIVATLYSGQALAWSIQE